MLCRARKQPCDEGAAAVEFALLFPIFFMVCIGTITFGFAFEKWISVTQAAREASRFAATYPNPNGTTWVNTVGQAAAESAGLVLPGTPGATDETSYYLCVRFTPEPATTAPGVQLKTWGTLPAATCPTTTLPDSRVDVTLSRLANVNWLFGTSNLNVSGTNTSRFEPSLVVPTP